MRPFLLLLFLLLLSITSIAQCGEEGRYLDIIFPDYTKTQDVEYGANYTFEGIMQNLFLDVYEPVGDAMENRPLIILAHGGSFVGGSKEGADVVPLCEDLCRMGYVVASIQYRLGVPQTFDLEQPFQEAVARGMHDMHAAVRFFKKDVAENGNTWNVDPDRIIIGGSSAGGFIALHHAYLDEEPEVPDWFQQDVVGLAGGLEGESGNPGYDSDVIGVINIAGALKDTSWIQPGDEPLVSFHGTDDTVVPFGSDILYVLGVFAITDVDGSEPIHERTDELGITNCFEIYEFQDHVPHVGSPQYYDTTRAIISSFCAHLVCPDIVLDCDYRIIGDVTNVEEITSKQLKIWPNPAAEIIRFDLGSGLKSFEIIDDSGRIVLVGDGTGEIEVDVSNWHNGMYILQSEGNGKRIVGKFSVRR